MMRMKRIWRNVGQIYLFLSTVPHNLALLGFKIRTEKLDGRCHGGSADTLKHSYNN